MEAFICAGLRTPIGRYAGALAAMRADDLAAHPIRALMARHTSVDWERADEVVLGCANGAGEDNRNIGRMAALLAGLPASVPGLTVNRLCASGLDAVAHAARVVRVAEGTLVIAGGTESMTRAPFVVPKATKPFDRRQAEIHDTTIGWRFVNPAMKGRYGIHSMPETADEVAERWGVSRVDQDAFATRSQARCAAAAAFYADEIAPVELHGRSGSRTVDADEHPRPGTTVEALRELEGINGRSVTAGNASGVNDGAAAMIVASEAAARREGLEPVARVVSVASAGVEPRVMGIGPVPASRRALDLAGLSVADMDVIEINEAFAAQVLASTRELGLADDAEHVNPNGGAIALGHPLGMTGARLALTAARELSRRGGRYALVTLCVGVGQGVAMVLAAP